MLYEIKNSNGFDYIEEGEGHPIVLLHGLMGGLSNFDSLTAFLSVNGFKVFAPILPIFSLPMEKTNVICIAEIVKTFLTEVVKAQSTLIGNSLGGHIGLILTHDYPEIVNSLVLTGSSGLYERSFGETFPKRGNYEYVKQKAEEVFYDPKVATKEIIDEVYETVNNRDKAMKTLYIARSAIKHNMKEELKNITQPVCLVWGKQDNVTPPEVAIEFDKHIDKSTLYWIDDCGHAPMMEHPDEFNANLYEWLQKINLVKDAV